MRRLRYILYQLLFLLMIIITGCDSNNESEIPSDMVTLSFYPSINTDATLSRGSPAILTGDKFESVNDISKFKFGMWLCQSGSLEPYSLGMDNMEAIYDAQKSAMDSWEYFYGGTTHKKLSAKPHSDIDIYAYYPYNSEVTDPTKVPFSVPDNDLLWAPPVKIHTGEANTTEIINLEYQHMLACIELKINVLHNSSENYLQEIRISESNPEESLLYENGELNIIDGTIELTQSSAVPYIEINKINTLIPNNSTITISAYIPIIPIEGYTNQRFTLSLGFSAGKYKPTTEVRSTQLPTIGDVDVMDFKQGYKYIYDLYIDNEMTIKALTIDSNWVNGPKTDFVI